MRAARVIPRLASFSIPSILPMTEYSHSVKPVKLPPGFAKLATSPVSTGSPNPANTTGMDRVCCCRTATARRPETRITSGFRFRSSAASVRARPISIRRPALIDMQVNAFRPAHLPKLLSEGRHARLDVAVALGKGHQNTDLSRARFLLYARRDRPRHRRAAEKGDEVAPPHAERRGFP